MTWQTTLLCVCAVALGGCSLIDDFGQFREVDGGLDATTPDGGDRDAGGADAGDSDAGDGDAGDGGEPIDGGDAGACLDEQQLCNGECVDIARNPMACGACTNVCDFGDLCVDRACIAPTVPWAYQLEAATMRLAGTAVVGDSLLVVAGHYRGQPRWNGANLPSSTVDRAFLTAIERRTGSILWTTTFGGSADVRTFRIAAVSAGTDQFVIGGTHSGAFSYGSDVSIPYDGVFDSWVIAVDRNGDAKWGAAINNAGPVRFVGLTASPSGDTYVAFNYDGGPLVIGGEAQPPRTDCRLGLVRFGLDDGAFGAFQTHDSCGLNRDVGFVFDGVHVVGSARGGGNLGGEPIPDAETGLDGRFSAGLEFDRTFATASSGGVACDGEESYFSVAPTARDSRLISGVCNGTATFGGGEPFEGVFLVEVDANDVALSTWGLRSGAFAGQAVDGLDGAYYSVGSTVDVVDFGFGERALPAGGEDAYVVALDPDRAFEPLWGLAFGGAGRDAALNVQARDGRVVVSGFNSGAVAIGTTVLPAPATTNESVFIVAIDAPF